MGEWDSRQYLLFKNERTQPAIDLVNRLNIVSPRKIIDIGCGPGNSSQVLARKFPKAYILGIDKSPDMIETARRCYPDINFQVGDISRDLATIGDDIDIIFSNACLQWVPNHRQLLPGLFKLLKPGGALAVQIPMNQQEPIHKIIAEVSTSEKWKLAFTGQRRFFNLTPSEYFAVLSEISAEFSMWETIYYHKLKSPADIMEWYRGSGLRPYLRALAAEKRGAFEQDILARVKESYPAQKNGEIIFRFPRFFFICGSKRS